MLPHMFWTNRNNEFQLAAIYLGGICVSHGYINLPDQTTERFLHDPFSPTTDQMFRMGDLARLLSNGHFEIVGRKDSQVKLKGYRIELDDVADAIMSHPRVTTAAAIVRNKTHLVGYLTPADVSISELHDVVASHLPVYMVPAVWVGLDEMPQNANGKIDKKNLEALDVKVEAETLETETEKQMAAVWARVLAVNVAEIGRQTSIFAIGGDSLSVIRVMAACKEVGMEISTAQLLKDLVLWKVAASVSNQQLTISWPRVSMPQEIVESITNQYAGILDVHDCLVYPVTPLQAGMVYATVSNPTSYVMQIPLRMKQSSDVDNLCVAFQHLVRKHDILRTTFVMSTAGIYQIIHPDHTNFDIAHASTSDLDEFFQLDCARGFEIGDAYFVRLTTVATANDQYVVLSIHHALYDGWTMSMLMSDLFVDYIEAQEKKETVSFWCAYLSDLEPSVVGMHQANHVSQEHDEKSISIVSQLSIHEISKTAQCVNLTTAEFTKLAWAKTLRKYTRQNNVAFGQVMANRNIPVQDADRIRGPLLSTVPCRIKFDDTLSSQQLIDAVLSERGVMIAHAHASLLYLKRWSGIEGEMFDSLFVFQNLPVADVANEYDGHTVDLMVIPTTEALILQATFDPQRLDGDQARWMLSEFDHSICQLVEVLGSNVLVSDLRSLSANQSDAIHS
ncbi:hypothetical protein As57867_006395, partial [Aphanomyces stellatus]